MIGRTILEESGAMARPILGLGHLLALQSLRWRVSCLPSVQPTEALPSMFEVDR